MNSPCVSGSLRNIAPGGVPVFNPLGCNRMFSAKISVKPLDLPTSRPRPSGPRCVTSSSNSPREPIERTDEVPRHNVRGSEPAGPGNARRPWVAFASSLVSAVISESEIGGTKKKRDRKGERTVYLLAAIASSVGFVTLAAGAVFYRFYWQMQVCTVRALILFRYPFPFESNGQFAMPASRVDSLGDRLPSLS